MDAHNAYQETPPTTGTLLGSFSSDVGMLLQFRASSKYNPTIPIKEIMVLVLETHVEISMIQTN